MKTPLKFAVLLLALTMSFESGAAVSKKAKSVSIEAPSAKGVLLKETQAALNLPIEERMPTLRAQGEGGYRNLVSLMFNDNISMQTRWKALTSASRIGGKSSVPEIERSLKSKEWFMRNAGLVAMVEVDRELAKKWARRLMDDKALVVRAAAVESFVEMNDRSATDLLWKKLNAKENFRSNYSLFIRRRIVEALGKLESPGREQKFVALLSDKDQTLYPHAVLALETFTKKSLGPSTDPIAFKRERWQKWGRENTTAASSAKL